MYYAFNHFSVYYFQISSSTSKKKLEITEADAAQDLLLIAL